MQDSVIKDGDDKGADAADSESHYYHIFRMHTVADKAVYQLPRRVKNEAYRGKQTGVFLCKKRFLYHFRCGNAQYISGYIACKICRDTERAYSPCLLRVLIHLLYPFAATVMPFSL